MQPISIAIIGAGWIGQKHAEILMQEAQYKLVAISDPAPAAVSFAQSIGVPHFHNYSELLDTARPEAVIIATPNILHVPVGLACAERGIHMLVEKPIADKVNDAVKLTQAVKKANVSLLVGHHRRHNPIIEKAREIVKNGEIGKITALSAHMMVLKAPDYFEATHRRSPGAGPITTNSVHDIDDLRYICGDIVSVQAMSSNAVRNYPVEDTAAIIFRFAKGALGTLVVSDTAASPWSWELTSRENTFYPPNDENCYLISGCEGSLTVPKLELWRYKEDKGWKFPLEKENITITSDDPLIRQIRHFYRVIREGEAPRVTGDDAIATLKVVLAIFESIRTGHCVEIN